MLRDWKGNCYIWDMESILNFRLYLTEFSILNTNADGGHHYLITNFEYKGKTRRLNIFFLNKYDEDKLFEVSSLTVEGELREDGNEDILLSNAIIVN